MHKVPTVRSYVIVFLCLIVLTLLTSWVAYLPIGHLHTPVGLIIAVGKAFLVVCFFMHLFYSDRVNWVMMGAAVFMFFIMVYLTMADYLSRT
jgi:cytochrome c oxidase subunit 4